MSWEVMKETALTEAIRRTQEDIDRCEQRMKDITRQSEWGMASISLKYLYEFKGRLIALLPKDREIIQMAYTHGISVARDNDYVEGFEPSASDYFTNTFKQG